MTYVVLTFAVLVFLNIYCSEINQRQFFQGKQNTMVEKATLIAGEIAKADVLNHATAINVVSRTDIDSLSRLIVTDASSAIIYDSTVEISILSPTYALFPQVIQALQGVKVFTANYHDGFITSVAAVPIINGSATTGCLYIIELDGEDGHLLQTLQNNILTITLLLEIGLILFAVFYVKRYTRRLRKIMASMRIIQEGDYSHKVRLGGHDELTILGEEFNYLTERLQISENKRRQFVSDASHELKTPLSSIKLLSDSILQYDMDMQTVREFAGDIGSEADRLNRMTLKLLALTKDESDTTENELEIIYMTPTIERVVKMLNDIAGANNITITTELKNDSPILIQEDDLYQITFNLVENGIKYNVSGGTLSISLHRQEDMATLRISDTGVGIPPDALSHVFERFYRVDKARARQSGGSGLGLAIVKNMVERNNGEIHVQSTVGKGTTFTVSFPCFDMEVESDEK